MPYPIDHSAEVLFAATHCVSVNGRQEALATSHAQALDRLFGQLAKTIALPPIARRILEIAANPSSNLRDMRSAIQTDPVLETHLLRRINSSQFNMSNKIATLTTAIGLLGIPEIRNLAISILVGRIFQQTGSYRSYSRQHLWRHCCGVAYAARKIARITGTGSLDEAFIAGLLHHTGTIVLDKQLRRNFRDVIDQLDDLRRTHEIEQRIYSFDQSQLSAFIARQWQLPATITDAIRYYQYPERYTGPHAAHVCQLAVANFLCHRAGWSSLGVRNAATPSNVVFASLGLTKTELAILWDELKASLHESLLD